MATLILGTYPSAGLGTPVGQGEGLWRADWDGDGIVAARQVTTEQAPSFVVTHPHLPLAYAVEEADVTALAVWSLEDSPVEVARVTVGGSFGCHVLLAADARALYVCNYGSGELAVVRLGADGLPKSDTPDQFLPHAGSGPREDRQEGPHAHFAALSPGGTHVIVCDLGTDEVRRYALGDDGLLGECGIAATLPPGSGPRHLAVRGELLYLVCELDHQVRTLRWDRETATALVIAEQPTTLCSQRTGDTVYDAHVQVVPHQGGDVLLISVRGADVISVFDVAPEGELTYRAAFDAGYWPRHFAVVGESLVVGAEKGHELRVYGLDDVLSLAPESESGACAVLDFRVAPVTSPACIAAVDPR